RKGGDNARRPPGYTGSHTQVHVGRHPTGTKTKGSSPQHLDACIPARCCPILKRRIIYYQVSPGPQQQACRRSIYFSRFSLVAASSGCRMRPTQRPTEKPTSSITFEYPSSRMHTDLTSPSFRTCPVTLLFGSRRLHRTLSSRRLLLPLLP
ncbi:unnamed protein product, partial [Ectocarpus sp. 8 AP-2014]